MREIRCPAGGGAAKGKGGNVSKDMISVQKCHKETHYFRQ